MTTWCDRCGLSLIDCRLCFGGGQCPILDRPSGWRVPLILWQPHNPVDLVRQPGAMHAIAEAIDNAPPFMCPVTVELPDGRVIKLDPIAKAIHDH